MPLASHEDLFLVGPWDTAPHDLMQWGLASGSCLLRYSVRDGTLRLARLRAREQHAQAYAPAGAVTPSLARPGAATALAARQEDVFRRKFRDGRAAAPSRVPVDEATLVALYRQPWMDPSPPRPPPRDRSAPARGPGLDAAPAGDATLGALGRGGPDPGPSGSAGPGAAGGGGADAAAAGGGSQGGVDGGGGRRDDAADALQPRPAPAERKVWSRVFDRRRTREERTFWFLLRHAALNCGGGRAVFCPPGRADLLRACCCDHAACRAATEAWAAAETGGRPAASSAGPRVETLVHALLECPAVRPAVVWLAGVVGAIAGTAPPLDADVWLVDEGGAWRPPRPARWLWDTLRCTLLLSAWSLGRRRRSGGPQFSSAAVVDACVRAIERRVLADWQRVRGDVTGVAGTSPWWFRGRHVGLTLAEFEERWCHGGVVASVAPGGAAMSFLLGATVASGPPPSP